MSLLKKLSDKLTKRSQYKAEETKPEAGKDTEKVQEEVKVEENTTVKQDEAIPQATDKVQTFNNVPTFAPPPTDQSPLEKEKKQLQEMQVDFVSMASHELRTPITSLIGYLNALNEEARNKLTEEQKSFLDRSLVSANQILALVNNILNVSKVERGAFSVSLKPLDWKKTLEKIVAEDQVMAVERNIILKLNLPDKPLPQVNADELRIGEVLNNLLSNALSYTKPGGKIEITAQVQGNEVVTSVADNGPGIPKDAMPHLFTKFFRVQKALDVSSSSSGSGLGLYISKSIVDLHHGRIWVESEDSKGSTFSFSLPIA